MFGSKRAKLNQVLNQLAVSLPKTRWIVLIDKKGVDRAVFPKFISDLGRISAMSAAAKSLGERINNELNGGELRYTFIGGTLNTFLVISLGSGYVLAVGLHPSVYPETFVKALKESVAPLLDALEIDGS